MSSHNEAQEALAGCFAVTILALVLFLWILIDLMFKAEPVIQI